MLKGIAKIIQYENHNKTEQIVYHVQNYLLNSSFGMDNIKPFKVGRDQSPAIHY